MQKKILTFMYILMLIISCNIKAGEKRSLPKKYKQKQNTLKLAKSLARMYSTIQANQSEGLSKISSKNIDSYEMPTSSKGFISSSGKIYEHKKIIAQAIRNKNTKEVTHLFTSDIVDINENLDSFGNALMQLFGDKKDFDIHMLTTLLALGADPNSKNDNYTALTIAVWFQLPEAVQTLLQAGADVNLKTKKGWSTWNNRGNNQKIVKLLEEYKEKNKAINPTSQRMWNIKEFDQNQSRKP